MIRKGAIIMSNQKSDEIFIIPSEEWFKKINEIIPQERRIYGCENGSVCCFRCVGKENCHNWYINIK